MSASNPPPAAITDSSWALRSAVTNQSLATCSKPSPAREGVGLVIGQQDMRAVLHRRPRRGDRRAGGAKPGDRARAPLAPIHDRRVELDMAVGGQHAAAPGVEAGASPRAPGPRPRPHRAPTRRPPERRSPASSDAWRPARALVLGLGREAGRAHRAAAAVDHQGPAHRPALTGHGSGFQLTIVAGDIKTISN